MKTYLTVFLRIALFVSLAGMVFDDFRIQQKFILMERGLIEEFIVDINTWPGKVFIVSTSLFLLATIIQSIGVIRNKNAIGKAFFTPEYDVSDERAVKNTQTAVSFAFSIILVYSFIVLGSYMFVPNYFIDYPWYPLFTTASIPIVGLLVYLITYKALECK